MVTVKALAFTLCLIAKVFAAPAVTVIARDDGKPDKPILNPPIPDLSDHLIRDLNSYQGKETIWPAEQTFEVCNTWFDKLGLDIKDAVTSNVTYADCDQPWMVCRHSTANWSGQVVKEYFGRLPTRIRSNIAHLVTVSNRNGPPNLKGKNGVVHDRELNALVVIGSPTFHDFMAGAAKPLAFNNRGYKAVGPFYNSDYWKKAVEKDSNVADAKAAESDEQNLAEMTVVALFDTRVRGGIKMVAPNADGVCYQKDTITKWILPDTLDPKEGFKCPNRLPNGNIISK